MPSFLDRVRDILEDLPPERRVLRAPVPEHWLAELETHHAFRFPDDYRGLLVEIGVVPPLLTLVDTGILPGTEHPPRLGRPFPYERSWNLSEVAIRWLDISAAALRGYYKPPSGALPICQLDRALRDYLIVSGPDRGMVWHDARADRNGWHPYVRPDGARVSFAQWFLARLAEVARHGEVDPPSAVSGGVALPRA